MDVAPKLWALRLLGAVISGGSAGCFGREAALSAVDNGDIFAYY
jgi:hypothetical protein